MSRRALPRSAPSLRGVVAREPRAATEGFGPPPASFLVPPPRRRLAAPHRAVGFAAPLAGRLRRRAAVAAAAVVALALLGATPAAAHPLGNFSVNHLAQVRVSADRVDVRYVLDVAEIPTFQARGIPRAERVRAAQAEALRGLRLTVDGRSVALRLAGKGSIAMPPGEGGLATTRIELALRAAAAGARAVTLRDDTYADRVGWKAIVVAPGRGTAVRSDAPVGDPTNGLRRYPEALLDSPADLRAVSLRVAPGAGTVSAPDGSRSLRPDGGGRPGRDGFAGVFEDAAAGEGVLLLLLATAFGWGALHALSPGHGKAMVAAYLVGTRGSTRDAIALGATVTFTHTIGVIALGLVALLLSAYVLPEDLYPWLQLVSGMLVVAVGAAVLRDRLRRGRDHHTHSHGLFSHAYAHSHGHAHTHEHGAHAHGAHAHAHTHAHGAHAHGAHTHAAHTHEHDARSRRRRLLALGASAGLVPCPSALVVLLGAVSQHEVVLGLVLILAFSAGLAMTLTLLGIAVVHAAARISRLRAPGLAATLLPIASAGVIVGVGCVLTAQALPQLS